MCCPCIPRRPGLQREAALVAPLEEEEDALLEARDRWACSISTCHYIICFEGWEFSPLGCIFRSCFLMCSCLFAHLCGPLVAGIGFSSQSYAELSYRGLIFLNIFAQRHVGTQESPGSHFKIPQAKLQFSDSFRAEPRSEADSMRRADQLGQVSSRPQTPILNHILRDRLDLRIRSTGPLGGP